MATFSQLVGVSKQTKIQREANSLGTDGLFCLLLSTHREQFNLESARVSKGMTGCYNYKLL